MLLLAWSTAYAVRYNCLANPALENEYVSGWHYITLFHKVIHTILHSSRVVCDQVSPRFPCLRG